MSQSAVCSAINNLTRALVKRAPQFINFQREPSTITANKMAFHAVARFPNILGAIDCMHIAIKAPSVNEEAFVNRKGIHTINVQAV